MRFASFVAVDNFPMTFRVGAIAGAGGRRPHRGGRGEWPALGVDTPEDLAQAERRLARR